MANANLASEIGKSNLELSFTNNWNLAKLSLILFLNLDNFAQKSPQDFILLTLLPLPTPSTLLFLLTDPKSSIVDFTLEVFNIEVIVIAIWLKL